jgi:restriction endonuclease S subunit
MKVSLGDISEIQVGYQSREGIRTDPKGSHWLIQARDVDKQHQVQWSNLTRFTPSGSTSKYELIQGDVLFLARGKENYSCLIEHETKDTLAANSFYILRVNQEIVFTSYMAWWLNQTSAQDFIRLYRSGISLPFISISVLSKLEVSIPTFEIQKKIIELEKLRKRETYLTASLLEKKSALIEAISLNAITE